MKNLRTLNTAAVLTLVLAAPVFAGHIECPVAPPPPPPSAVAIASWTDTESVAGHIEIGVAPTDPVTGAAFLLFQSVFTLF